MGTDCKLPFKVDQQAESKSFLTGYRGAWFRCKIIDIGRKKGQLSYALNFFDFPDEKTTWTKLYQKPLTGSANSWERKMELIVRPSFPPVYLESQIPDASAFSDVVVIIANVWKVGDLVDWWTDGCYWSGRITHVLGNDKVQVELPTPPVGEGNTYEAFCKDLRPSLNWSPEQGWTVPISTDNGTCCARLIRPVNQNKSRKDGCATGEGPSSETSAPVSSYSSACSLLVPDRSEQPPEQKTTEQPTCGEVDKEGQSPHTNIELGLGDSSMGKANGTCSVSSSSDKGASAVAVRTTKRKDRYGYGESPKKMRISGNECLNSTSVPDRSEQPPEQEATEQPSCGEVDKEGQSSHTNTELDLGHNSVGKANGTCSVSSSSDKGASAVAERITGKKDRYGYGESPKKMSVSGNECLNSMSVQERSELPPEQETAEQPSCGEVVKEGQRPHSNTELGLGDSSMGKANGTCSVSSSSEKGASAVAARTTGRKDRYGYGETLKKMRISGNECLNSMRSDTIESAILDLEELANRIKWLKGVLQLGFPLSNAMRPPWKFLENRASFTQR